MSTEDNKAVIRHWLTEGWSRGNVDLADEIIDPNFVVHGAGGQPIPSGPAGVKQLVREWRTGFPDGRMDIDGMLAEGDLVAIRMTWRGTHNGIFYGIAPTGRQVTVTSIGVDRVVNGMIVEGWGEIDMLGLYQQLGVIPLPAQG